MILVEVVLNLFLIQVLAMKILDSRLEKTRTPLPKMKSSIIRISCTIIRDVFAYPKIEVSWALKIFFSVKL